MQGERRGTAHAVLAARSAIAREPDDVLVVFGDTPLIRPQTLSRMRHALAQGAALVVLAFRPADPTGYGRILMKAAAKSPAFARSSTRARTSEESGCAMPD